MYRTQHGQRDANDEIYPPLIKAGLKWPRWGKNSHWPAYRYYRFIAGRIYETQRGPALHPWHTRSADEMSTAEIDRSTFAGYLAREDAIFHEMKIQLTNTLPDDQNAA